MAATARQLFAYRCFGKSADKPHPGARRTNAGSQAVLLARKAEHSRHECASRSNPPPPPGELEMPRSTANDAHPIPSSR